LQRRDREWCCPAGGNADHHVVRRELRGIDLRDRILDIVLRALDAGDECAVSAGDDEANALARPGECRRQLGAVLDCHAARGAGADINDASVIA